MRHRRLLTCTCFLLAAHVMGCQRFRHDAQCADIAETTNETLTQVAELEPAGKEAASPNAYVDIAQMYRDLETKLSKLELSTELEQGAIGLRNVLKNAARESDRFAEVLRDLQGARETDDEAALKRAQRSLDASRKRMERTVQSYDNARKRLDKMCSIH